MELFEEDLEVMPISDEDAAFVLGRGGSTKRKIERVSSARLNLPEREEKLQLKLEIRGDSVERERALLYVKLVLAQRVGSVYIDFNERRPDLSVVTVPEDCFGFITGKKGVVLRSLEEEWGTLMFFAKGIDRDGRKTEEENLAIFGPRRGRRGAELKVMSAVERKSKGWFVDETGVPRKPLDQPGDDDDDEEWGYETRFLENSDFSYALGSQGSTRKKIAKASHCILEYVGKTAYSCGTRRERKMSNDYLNWLLQQRTGNCQVDWKDRDDVTCVKIPMDCVGFITGHRGETLRRYELETETFCFTEGDKEERNESGYETLLIFGHSESGRKQAQYMFEDKVEEKQELERQRRERDRRNGRDGHNGRDRHNGWDRDRGPDRDRGSDPDRDRNDRRGRSRSRDRCDGGRDGGRGRSRSRSPQRRGHY